MFVCMFACIYGFSTTGEDCNDKNTQKFEDITSDLIMPTFDDE